MKEIAYVHLANVGAATPTSSFVMQHMQHANYQVTLDDPPHRHDFHELFVVESGRGQHMIDNTIIQLQPYTISLIGRGRVHNVQHFADATIWVVRFSDNFLPADMLSATWNYQTLFNQLGSNHSFTTTPADFATLQVLLEQIKLESMHQANFQQENALRHLLAVLLIRVERLHQQSFAATQHDQHAYRLYQAFLVLLDQHFALHHDVQFYADELKLAPIRLSRVLNQMLGKTTKQVIDERIMLEAKRFLLYTSRSVKDIAYSLGYTDMFQFSRAFKRITGVAPNTYREQRQKVT